MINAIRNRSAIGSSCKPPQDDALLLGWQTPGREEFGFASAAPRQAVSESEPVLYRGPHLATIAGTGTGKGVSCAIPALLDYLGQAVVLDIKGELYITTARRRREMGQHVIKIDPFQGVDCTTDSLNPLDILQLPGADLETDCQTIAKLLSTGKESARDPFWHLSANGLNAGNLAYLCHNEPLEQRTLRRLCELIYGDDVSYNLALLLDTKGKQMPKMSYQEIAAFLQLSERETRPSTLATAQSFVKNLNSDRVAAALSHSTVSLGKIRAGAPVTIYIIIPPDRLQSHSALLTLWIGTLLKTIFSRQAVPPLRTLMLIVEAASLGNFPMLETAITLCRSWEVRVWTFWQDLQQLQNCYPTGWKTLLNNCAIQTFGITKRLMAE